MVDITKLDMSKIWAASGDKVQPADSQIASGWLVQAAYRQTWNWFENRQDQNIAYMLQKGFPEWDSTTQYIINKSYVQRNNIVYKAIATTTGDDPVGSSNWVKAFPESSVALEALKPLIPAADTIGYFNGTTTAASTSLTAFARTVLSAADAATVRSTISAQISHINLTTLSTVTAGANALPYFTGTNTATTTLLTAFARSLIGVADAPTARSTLGLGNASVLNVGTTTGTVAAGDDSRVVNALQLGNNLSDVASVTTTRSNLGLSTGAISTVTTSNVDTTTGRLLKFGDFGVGAPIVVVNADFNTLINSGEFYCNGTLVNSPTGTEGWLRVRGITSSYATQYFTQLATGLLYVRQLSAGVWGSWGAVYAANNTSANVQSILGAANYAAIVSLLGLSNKANAGANSDITSLSGLTTALSVAQGGTGVTSSTGTGNTVRSDSPTFTGVPFAPTASFGANSTQVATTAFVIANATAMPAGALLEYAGPISTAPAGFLLANGAAVSRTTYATLYAAIGTYWGAGDGSTTFNLPDARGQFVRGLDNGRGVDPSRALGTTQASQNLSHTHTGTSDAAGTHNHSASSDVQGSHNHTTAAIGFNGAGSQYGIQFAQIAPTALAPTTTDGAHAHNISIAAVGNHQHTFTTGGSGGTEARPTNIAVNIYIKY